MNRSLMLGVAAALTAGCTSLPGPTQLADSGEFPPPVIAGVTRFAQTVPEYTMPDTSVPPPVVWGVTRFPQTVVDRGVPDSSVDKPVAWVRFGVTREAAEREAAIAGAKPAAGKGG